MKTTCFLKNVSILSLTVIMILLNGIIPVNAAGHFGEGNRKVVEEFNVLCSERIDDSNDMSDIPQQRSHIRYIVTQTGKKTVKGAYTGQTVSGVPGMTIALTNFDATSFSASSNVSYTFIKDTAQSALGFSFSKTHTISHSGSFTIPTVYNGRKIKRAEIEAYELYNKYDFKVTWTSIHVTTPQYFGSYWAKNPCGYHYRVIYYLQ